MDPLTLSAKLSPLLAEPAQVSVGEFPESEAGPPMAAGERRPNGGRDKVAAVEAAAAEGAGNL